MSNQILLGAIIGPFYVVLGLSILLYSKTWIKLATDWAKNHLSLIGMMMFTLIFGLTVINLYNVWEWNIYLLVTISGWAAFLKGIAYFLLPGDSLRSIIKTFNKEGFYQGAGFVSIALGAWLSYTVYLA